MARGYKIRSGKGSMLLKENEVLWVSKHQKKLEQYAGKWIAVLGNKLIGTGDSVKEVMTVVKRKGIKELPLVTMVPKKDEGMYVL